MIIVIKKEKWFVLLFGAIAALFFYLTRNYVDSADLIQYLSQAKRYEHLPLREAANDYWSPLLSWLIIPFSFLTQDYLLGFKLLQFVLCLVAFVLGLLLRNQLNLSDLLNKFFLVIWSVLVLNYGLNNGSPDLLYLDILLFVFCIFHSSPNINSKSAFLMGLCGALLFLAKSFGFVFFIVFIFSLFFLFRKENYFSRKSTLILLVTFLSFSLPWVCILSLQQKRLIISSSAEYNFNIMNPAVNPDIFGEIKHPINQSHIYVPTEKFQVSAWLHPHSFHLKKWTPDQNISHYFSVVMKNTISLFYYYFDFFLLIFLLVVLTIFNRKLTPLKYFKEIVKPILESLRFFGVASLLTTFLYVLILTQQRYLWANEIFLLFILLFLLRDVKLGFQLVFLLGFMIFSFLTLAKNISGNLHSVTNVDWNKNEFTNVLSANPQNFSCISDFAMGPDGYTLNSAICFSRGGLNYGVLRPEEISSGTPADFFLSSANHAIKQEEYPFLEFVAYSSTMNASLYRIKH